MELLKNPEFKRLMRLLILISLYLLLLFSIDIFPTPTLASGGLLGFLNFTVIVFLVILGLRHILILVFAELEHVRQLEKNSTSDKPGVSIIVPAYNEEVVIAKTIRSLKKIDYPVFEVIVVDDGSSDKTCEKAEEAAANDSSFRVFKRENTGKWGALNFGVTVARHDYVMCIDADSEINSEALTEGIKHFEDPDVSAVAGTVFVINQKSLLGKFQALEYMLSLIHI